MIKKIFKKVMFSQDPKFRIPRIFSNNELKKFAHLFNGKIVNVSGWNDEDKQGSKYRDYFFNSSEYWITNYRADQKGIVGQHNEIFLDLEKNLTKELVNKFDVVFNHTTLEHIYNCQLAFKNLCKLSNDVVIIVVPYLQQIHGVNYYDYWRFTPYTVKKMFEENGLNLRYCSANGADKASIYLVCIGYKNEKWDNKIPYRFDLKIDKNKKLYDNNYKNIIGGNII